MNFLDSITSGIKGKFDKRKEEREVMHRLQSEAKIKERMFFEEEFRKNALEVARAKAKKDASRLSGIQKLRSMNRARRLTQPSSSALSKLSQFTQKNLAKREENLKATKELREEARRQREERILKHRQGGMGFSQTRKPFKL